MVVGVFRAWVAEISAPPLLCISRVLTGVTHASLMEESYKTTWMGESRSTQKRDGSNELHLGSVEQFSLHVKLRELMIDSNE